MYNVMLSIAGTLAVLMVMFYALYWVVEVFGMSVAVRDFFGSVAAICCVLLVFDIILSAAFLLIAKLWESLT